MYQGHRGRALVSRPVPLHGVEPDGVGPPPMTPLPHSPAPAGRVGRPPACAPVAAGDGVSARHCRLTATAAGLVVEDLGSTNGTFVNRMRVTGRAAVRPGDRVALAPPSTC